MAGQNAYPSHLDITFSVGTDLLVITPLSFDVEPYRRDSGVVYSKATFTAPLCQGNVHDVFVPEDFHKLAAALTKMMKGEDVAVSISGLESWFCFGGSWNAQEQVAVFKASMPKRLGPGDWSLWHEPSHYRGSMKSCVELDFWMEPAALEEPIAQLEAVLEHIEALRDAFRLQGHTFDTDANRWT